MEIGAPSALDVALRAGAREQLVRFERLRGQFADRYAALPRAGLSDLVEREWAQRNEALERDVLPAPPLEFIRHPSLLWSMFVSERYLRHEFPLVSASFGAATLARALPEDPVGGPLLAPTPDGSSVTSANTVHHLYHLARFSAETGVDVAALGTVVEWGGGYGNLAKLFRRLHGGGPTYVVVDTPLFSCLQWLYLASVFGTDQVCLADAPGQPLRPGTINLVPVTLAASLAVAADLFVSTWALNESAPAAQDLVVGRDWFGAAHLLLGMHQGVALADRAVAGGARVVVIGDFMPGQTYVMR